MVIPQLVNITREWMKECVKIKDDAFIQMLLLTENTILLNASTMRLYGIVNKKQF